jgi:ABC-type sulfate transport system permease subunit
MCQSCGSRRSRGYPARPGVQRITESGVRQTERMDALAVVVLIVLLAVPLVIVGVMFVWAAIRDGEEDRAIQRRLGIRRKTRLGR